MWNSQSMYKKTEKQRDFNKVISSLHNKAISIKLAKLIIIIIALNSMLIELHHHIRHNVTP